jgi:hypothetical protein
MVKMEINVHVLSPSVALIAISALSAYLQSKNPLFASNITINLTEPGPVEKSQDKINVLFIDMPEYSKIRLEQYDMVLFSNADEPLIVANTYIVENLSNPNCYLIANSILHETHPLYQSVISSCYDLYKCTQYWRTPQYPQYYTNAENSMLPRTESMLFINGANRSWRHHIAQLLSEASVKIPIHSTISQIIHETDDAPWESKEDFAFRCNVNDMYPLTRNQKTSYYDDSVKVGFATNYIIEGAENNVSMVPPGYFIMPEYFKYQCIIFPETTWQNNELAMTEKSLKCFYSKSIPWPIGGANLNKLYNQIGFKTAWNLLPEHLQAYDDELDHFKRHKQTVESIKWMYRHSDILTSKDAELIRLQNKEKFLDNNLWKLTAESLLSKITKYTTTNIS